MAYTNTTLTTLLARLADRYEGQPFWTSDQGRRAINEGLRVWNALTGFWKAPFNATTLTNDPYLFIDGTLVKGNRVTVGGRVLIPSSLFAFDHGLRNWEGARTTDGGMVPSAVSYWAPVGPMVIALYPADASVAGQPVIVDGVRNTPILVSGGDFIDLGDEEINTLLGYALHTLSFSKGIDALNKTRPMRTAFFKAAAEQNDTFKASSAYRRIIGLDRTRFMTPMQDPPTPEETALIQATERGGGG